MLVAVGLFETAVPASSPLAGQLLLNGGRFLLPFKSAAPHVFLLGFAVPAEASLWRASAAEEVHVFSREIRAPQCGSLAIVEPRWRRVTEADPPIVAALPALFAGSGQLQSGRSGHRVPPL
jgi:hypothetical protein